MACICKNIAAASSRKKNATKSRSKRIRRNSKNNPLSRDPVPIYLDQWIEPMDTEQSESVRFVPIHLGQYLPINLNVSDPYQFIWVNIHQWIQICSVCTNSFGSGLANQFKCVRPVPIHLGRLAPSSLFKSSALVPIHLGRHVPNHLSRCLCRTNSFESARSKLAFQKFCACTNSFGSACSVYTFQWCCAVPIHLGRCSRITFGLYGLYQFIWVGAHQVCFSRGLHLYQFIWVT